MRKSPHHPIHTHSKFLSILPARHVGSTFLKPFSSVFVETKVIARVVVADVFDHFSDERKIVGKKSALDVIAEDVAKQTAEVFVARVGEE